MQCFRTKVNLYSWNVLVQRWNALRLNSGSVDFLALVCVSYCLLLVCFYNFCCSFEIINLVRFVTLYFEKNIKIDIMVHKMVHHIWNNRTRRKFCFQLVRFMNSLKQLISETNIGCNRTDSTHNFFFRKFFWSYSTDGIALSKQLLNLNIFVD